MADKACQEEQLTLSCWLQAGGCLALTARVPIMAFYASILLAFIGISLDMLVVVTGILVYFHFRK